MPCIITRTLILREGNGTRCKPLVMSLTSDVTSFLSVLTFGKRKELLHVFILQTLLRAQSS